MVNYLDANGDVMQYINKKDFLWLQITKLFAVIRQKFTYGINTCAVLGAFKGTMQCFGNLIQL